MDMHTVMWNWQPSPFTASVLTFKEEYELLNNLMFVSFSKSFRFNTATNWRLTGSSSCRTDSSLQIREFLLLTSSRSSDNSWNTEQRIILQHNRNPGFTCCIHWQLSSTCKETRLTLCFPVSVDRTSEHFGMRAGETKNSEETKRQSCSSSDWGWPQTLVSLHFWQEF